MFSEEGTFTVFVPFEGGRKKQGKVAWEGLWGRNGRVFWLKCSSVRADASSFVAMGKFLPVSGPQLPHFGCVPRTHVHYKNISLCTDYVQVLFYAPFSSDS